MKKITPEIVDKIKELNVAGVKYPKIVVVIERDFGVKISPSAVSDIMNGYRHVGKGQFTEKDASYINDLIDGNVFNAPVNLTRLMKFGFVEIYYREGVTNACKHYNETIREGYFTLEKAEEILEEVEKWIKSGDVRGENEEWFKELIEKRRNEGKDN